MTEKRQKSDLLPAYLFLSSDEMYKRSLLKRLTKRLSDAADLSFDISSFDAEVFKDAEAFLDACNTAPFLSPVRLVALLNVDKAGKALTEAVCAYLAAPCPTTVLALTASKLASNSRLLSAVRKIGPKAVLEKEAMKRNELPGYVCDLAKDYGLRMGSDAAQELIARVGQSTVALNKEIEKLAAFMRSSGRNNVMREDVRGLVSRAAQPSPFDFVDAVCSRSLAKAMASRRLMLLEKPHSLLALCVMRLRELIAVRTLTQRGCKNIAAELKLKDWQVRRIRDVAGRFSSEELCDLLMLASECDKAMKSGSDPEAALEAFVVAVAKN